MKRLAIMVCGAIVAVCLALGVWFGAPKPTEALALTCFYTDERVSGMNKICYYDCLGSAAAITINATSLCPLTINR